MASFFTLTAGHIQALGRKIDEIRSLVLYDQPFLPAMVLMDVCVSLPHQRKSEPFWIIEMNPFDYRWILNAQIDGRAVSQKPWRVTSERMLVLCRNTRLSES